MAQHDTLDYATSTAARTNRLAIAAFVLSLAGVPATAILLNIAKSLLDQVLPIDAAMILVSALLAVSAYAILALNITAIARCSRPGHSRLSKALAITDTVFSSLWSLLATCLVPFMFLATHR